MTCKAQSPTGERRLIRELEESKCSLPEKAWRSSTTTGDEEGDPYKETNLQRPERQVTSGINSCSSSWIPLAGIIKMLQCLGGTGVVFPLLPPSALFSQQDNLTRLLPAGSAADSGITHRCPTQKGRSPVKAPKELVP